MITCHDTEQLGGIHIKAKKWRSENNKLNIHVYGYYNRVASARFRVFLKRVKRVVVKHDWEDLFNVCGVDLGSVDGLLEFCNIPCHNRERLPSLIVYYWDPESFKYKPLPVPAKWHSIDALDGVRLTCCLGVQTDYASDSCYLTSKQIAVLLQQAIERRGWPWAGWRKRLCEPVRQALGESHSHKTSKQSKYYMIDRLGKEAIRYLWGCYTSNGKEFVVNDFRKYGVDGVRAYFIVGEEVARNPVSHRSVWYARLFQWVSRCVPGEEEARILSEILACRSAALGRFLRLRRDCGVCCWIAITLMMENDLSEAKALKGFLWGLSQERPECRDDLLSHACSHIVQSLLSPDPELQELALQSAMTLATPKLAPDLINALRERHTDGCGDPEEEKRLCASLVRCLVWPGPGYSIEKRVVEAAVKLAEEELEAFPVLNLVAVEAGESLKSIFSETDKIIPPLLWSGFESHTSAGDAVIRDACALDFSKQRRWLDKIIIEKRFFEECTTLFGTAIASAEDSPSRRQAVCDFVAESQVYLSGKNQFLL